MKIKNKNYRKFLDEGLIETIGQDEIKEALNNIHGRHKREGRALLIFLYFTGARPIEATLILSKNIKKQNNYIVCQVPASKRGLTRPVFLPYKYEMVKEFWKYCKGVFPEAFLFYHYTNYYTRYYQTKKGEIKTRIEKTNKIYYLIKKVFKNIVPDSIPSYFLRHNRFTKLSEAGASMTEIMQSKGCKKIESVRPYLHLSTLTAKKIARKID